MVEANEVAKKNLPKKKDNEPTVPAENLRKKKKEKVSQTQT
jgi:hypothetical protein